MAFLTLSRCLRITIVVLSAFILSGYTQSWQHNIIRVSCDNTHLSIEEIVSDSSSPTSSDGSHKIVLRYKRGFKWVEVDWAKKITPICSNLYGPDQEYVAFIADPERNIIEQAITYEPIRQYAWDVFVSPEQFSREEYRHISQCLADNIELINTAVLPHPDLSSDSPRWEEARPQIVSIVYKQYDDDKSSFARGPDYSLPLEQQEKPFHCCDILTPPLIPGDRPVTQSHN